MFETSDKPASFFGIITSTMNPSTIRMRGHMSKKGARTARWGLTIAVDTIILRNRSIKEYYDSVKNRKGSGKLAHLSTMKNLTNLTRMIFTMLKERKEGIQIKIINLRVGELNEKWSLSVIKGYYKCKDQIMDRFTARYP